MDFDQPACHRVRGIACNTQLPDLHGTERCHLGEAGASRQVACVCSVMCTDFGWAGHARQEVFVLILGLGLVQPLLAGWLARQEASGRAGGLVRACAHARTRVRLCAVGGGAGEALVGLEKPAGAGDFFHVDLAPWTWGVGLQRSSHTAGSAGKPKEAITRAAKDTAPERQLEK